MAVDNRVRTAVHNSVDNRFLVRFRYCAGQRQSMNSLSSGASGPALSMADGRATPNAIASVTGPASSHSGSSAGHSH
jgi:hypothetical protein